MRAGHPRHPVAAVAFAVLALLSLARSAHAEDAKGPPPVDRLERRSTPALVLGIVGVVVSVPTVLIGAMALGFCANEKNQGSFTPRRGECDLLPSTSVTALGAGLFVGGILGITWGSATVRVPEPSLVPRVAVGPGAASLTWRF